MEHVERLLCGVTDRNAADVDDTRIGDRVGGGRILFRTPATTLMSDSGSVSLSETDEDDDHDHEEPEEVDEEIE